MRREFIPWRRIILGATVISVIFTIVIIDLDQYKIIPPDNMDDGSNFTTGQDEYAARAEAVSVNIDWTKLILTSSLTLLGLLGLASTLLWILYLHFFNSHTFRTYCDTAIRLAGFEGEMPLIGREWKISDNVTLKLSGYEVHFIVPSRGDPREWGFKPTNDHATTTSSLEQLQLKLLLIRKYLDQKD